MTLKKLVNIKQVGHYIFEVRKISKTANTRGIPAPESTLASRKEAETTLLLPKGKKRLKMDELKQFYPDIGKKHNELALKALTWLKYRITNKGMRGTTEVSLDRGYVADAVAICSLQYRFFRFYTKMSFPEARPFNVNYFACVFEAKSSRADFLSTFNLSEKHQNRHKPIGNLHWCVTPKKLIKPDELPDFWGLLEEKGGGLTEIKKPALNIIENSQLDIIAHNLLWAIQARRNYIHCCKCGVFIQSGYCSSECAKTNPHEGEKEA